MAAGHDTQKKNLRPAPDPEPPPEEQGQPEIPNSQEDRLMVRLDATRIQQLPWWAHVERQDREPTQQGHNLRFVLAESRLGCRRCDLCGSRYRGRRGEIGETGERCSGGQACPTFWHMQRRDVEWHDGYWVPIALVLQWEAEDRSVCWRRAASADFVSQGTADFAVAFKAPPTRQQLADHQLRMQEERAAELERIPDQPAADSDNESIPPPWDSRYPAWEANQLRRS